MSRAVVLTLLLPVSACGGGAEPVSSGGAPAAPTPSGVPWFEEVSEASGLEFSWISGHEERHLFPEIMGGGAALLDMDGDGDLDIYLVQAGGLLVSAEERPGNVLYENLGDWRFRAVPGAGGADDRGYGMGVACGDFDDDGREDLYVTNVGANALFRNLGGGRFGDVTAAAGVGGDAWSTSAAFLDFDRDGDLDLFVVNYIEWSVADELTCTSKLSHADYCSPKSYGAPAPDVLYENLGDGTFRDVSAQVGLRRVFGNGLGIVCSDFDGDGFEDVFVANDGVMNQLWRNEAGERFVDVAVATGCAVDQDGKEKAGMGTHAVDVDDDGDEDLLVVNLTGEADTFFRNDGELFSDRTPLVGLAAASRPFTRFGMGFVDFDNDGRVDLFQANGRVTRPGNEAGSRPYDQPNLVFRGAESGRFHEVEPRGGTAQLLVRTSRAAAFGDLDGDGGDGGVDVVVVNRDGPLHVLRNRVGSGRWVALRLRERSGRAALGARVSLRLGERTITRHARSAYSYCAANDPTVHVGLGAATVARDVRVTWADGVAESFGDLAADGVHELVRGRGR